LIENLGQLEHQPVALAGIAPGGRFTGVETVLMDIDDTLWENNIFFLASLAWLCRAGRRCGHADRATISILNHWENFNIGAKGYGYDSYAASMEMAVAALVSRNGGRYRHLHAEFNAGVRRWTRFLKSHPIQWRAGVAETLPELTRRFRVIIVTKGHQGDQMAKVDRCGLKHLFHGAEVVPHKYPDCYRRVIAKYDLNPASTVMVGNSPRSDINMAKRAGLRTVYIPHPRTWFREVESILTDDPPTIEAEAFPQLLEVLRA